ncbi:MAG: hypothetical protein QGG40_15940, partial [Myxococcota bacterium]|nr:hypothetical protein [Myxococcota bacterium]
AAAARADHALAVGVRPFLVGEYGLVDTDRIVDLLGAVVDEGMAGAMIWSLRYHAVGGGFYWHTEYDDGDTVYRSYHWPGFSSGDPYDETTVLEAVRDSAFTIRGLDVPDVEPPRAPTLVAYEDAHSLVWEGSVGAGWYSLERSESPDGSWEEVASGFHDAQTANTAEIADETGAAGESWYYRLRAHNDGGASDPSEAVGPVSVPDWVLFTDELDDLTLVDSASSGLFIDDTNTSYFDGDAGRAARSAATRDSLVYSMNEIQWMAVEVFFWPWETVDPMSFETSPDGITYEALEVLTIDEGGDWNRLVYSVETMPEGTSHLKITWNNTEGTSWTPQVSRVELGYMP